MPLATLSRVSLEAMARERIARIGRNEPSEDGGWEFKAEVPEDYNKFARRLAGLANSAHHGEIYLVFGINERPTELVPIVVGVNSFEPSNWYSSLSREFCEHKLPASICEVTFEMEGKTIVAYALRTDEAPYLVKNASRGRSGEVIEWEVPWRQATSARSATRAELLSILLPIVSMPSLEIIDAYAHFEKAEPEPGQDVPYIFKLLFTVSVYIIPRDSTVLTLANHNIKILIESPDGKVYPLTNCVAHSTQVPHYDMRNGAIVAGSSNVLIHSAGAVQISGDSKSLDELRQLKENVTIVVDIKFDQFEGRFIYKQLLQHSSPYYPDRTEWNWRRGV